MNSSLFKITWAKQMVCKVLNWGETDKYEPVIGWDDADIITSKVVGKPDTHKVVLDIDLPCELIESATPGHFHLYIDKEVTWTQYQTLLWALVGSGIVDKNYAGYSKRRGFTAVRLPWKPKDPNHPPSDALMDGWHATVIDLDSHR